MEQKSSAPPSPTQKSPTNGARTQMGVQLLPLLVRYFKYVGALLAVWILGYFGFSTAWVMIGLFMYMSNEEYRKVKDSKKAFARHAALNEKEAILARVEELPAWVYFPDIEKAEWLNKIIKQMWPYIGDYTQDLLRKSVEPQVQNSLPKSLTPFKFEKIDLGDIPPRIGGVKVYIDNVKRDEIIMDLEISYMSDSDIKVAVRGITAGIKDLQIQGTLRVQMRPLVKVIPIIGGLNVFFLNTPNVDFDLTNTANILDVPVLSNTLRGVVQDQINYYMVLPNKIPIQLADTVSLASLKYPMPQGVLRLNVVAGRELKAADIKIIGKGKSDPYCCVYVGAQVFKTKVIKETVNPKWNQYFEAVVDQKHGQVVELEVMDQDPGEDDELGSASVDIHAVAQQGSVDTWLPLEGVKTGMIHIRALWLHLSKDPDDLQKALHTKTTVAVSNTPPGFTSKKRGKEENTLRLMREKHRRTSFASSANAQQLAAAASEEHLSSALLLVTLDSAKNLPRSKKGMSEPSPYAKIVLGNEDERKTLPQQNTTNPKWETNYEFLIHNPSLQNIFVEVYDSKKKDRKLGNFTYALKNLLTCKDLTVNRQFPLDSSAKEASVSMRLCLRILTSEMPEEWALDSGTSDPTTQEPEAEDVAASNAPIAKTEEPVAVAPSSKPVDTVGPVDSPNVSTTEQVTPPQEMSFPEGQTVSQNESAVMDRSGEGMRQRVNTGTSSESSESPNGQVNITVRYSQQRHKLIACVHKCRGLIPCDEDNLADPYVKMYIMPERAHKRKTEVSKNNLNPIFDETFEWDMPLSEVRTKSLEVTVNNDTGLFSKSKKHMGLAIIELSQFDVTKAHTDWYDLKESKDD